MMKCTRRRWNGLSFILTILFLSMLGGACRQTGEAPRESRDPAPATPAPALDPASVQDSKALIAGLSRAFEQAASKVSPSVVPIFAEQVVQSAGPAGLPDESFRDFFGEDFFRRFFGEVPPTKSIQRSLGSGVIVTADGYILTNNHVVANADKLTVVLGDKKSYVAKTVGTDPQSDLAVVRIEAKNLPFATLGDSDDVNVGEWVIAIGNPFQLMHTVTAGIISAKGRSDVGLASYEDFFQTDASINPGNSGGALSDLDGNVIGINTAIQSPSGGNVGIGFAIPINMAKAIMDQLIAKGKVIRGYLGLTPQDIDEDLAKALKLADASGALVAEVAPRGPAERAGVKTGDTIVAFDGKKVENSTSLRRLAAQAAPGSSVTLSVLRDGRRIELKVTPTERPKEPAQKSPAPSRPEESSPGSRLGISVQTLTPEIAQQLGYDKSETGVVVAEVASAGPADQAGLQRGDVIKEINRVGIRTAADFEREVKRFKKGDTVALLVKRGQASSYVTLTFE
jgi:serine protease Do